MVRSLFAAMAITAFSTSASAENWPQWRGPKNDGISNEKGLPSKWSADENIVWKAKLPGPGASTPCVWGEHLFVTAQEESGLSLLCYGTDGKEKWKAKLSAGKATARGDEGNLASASCSTDGKRVFAFVGSGELVAYDFAGKEVWKVDTAKVYGAFKIQFGAHWTPVLHKGKLYVTLMHQKLQQIVCFNADDGKEVWKADRTSDGKGESPDVYCSPFLWEKGDKALLIVHGNDYCTAHELADGKEVWRVTELNPKKKNQEMFWRAVSSPLVTPDLIVVPSCKTYPTVAIDPNGAKGEIAPGSSSEKWRFKSTPDVPSPLLVDGVVYLMGDKGKLNAVDAKTGKELYEITVTNERHRASPTYFDDKILLIGRQGNMVVIKPSREAGEMVKNKLPDTVTGSPAISGGRIYLRGWNYLWAIGTK